MVRNRLIILIVGSKSIRFRGGKVEKYYYNTEVYILSFAIYCHNSFSTA